MAESKRTFLEVDYRCSNQNCKHEQTIRYFSDDNPLPVTCCVNCRAGFNTESNSVMIMSNRGMFPVGKPRTVAA